MDATRLHLLVHHVPVVLSLAGALTFSLGLLLRRHAVEYYGALSLALAGAAAPFTYLSGRLAANELVARVTSEGSATGGLLAAVDAHGTFGLAATLALVAAGVVGAAWLTGRRGGLVSAGLVFLGLAAAGLAVAAGREGGRIRHEGVTGAAAVTPGRAAASLEMYPGAGARTP